MKSYTSVKQSCKLAEILPLESADMIWVLANPDLPMIKAIAYEDSEKSKYYEILPAWSLATLLSVIRETIGYTLYGVNNVYMSCDLGDKPWKLETEVYDNEVDACVEMILKLHELNLL